MTELIATTARNDPDSEEARKLFVERVVLGGMALAADPLAALFIEPARAGYA